MYKKIVIITLFVIGMLVLNAFYQHMYTPNPIVRPLTSRALPNPIQEDILVSAKNDDSQKGRITRAPIETTYENNLNNFISSEIGTSSNFIRSELLSMTETKFHEVVSSYLSTNDPRSKQKVISETILSDINSDEYLNLLYIESIANPSLLPSFVASTLNTNTYNSFSKLMEMNSYEFNQQVSKNLLEGSKLIYDGNIDNNLLVNVIEWMDETRVFSERQEELLVFLLENSPIHTIEGLKRANIHWLLEENQDYLYRIVQTTPLRK